MCGIAGYVGKTRLGREPIEKARAALAHRGPDAWGVYEHCAGPDRHVVLVHTRLAIIDLDRRADQPMRFGHHVLCFNGEIYNYRELRDLAVAQGERFLTQSDTEVLLHALARRGPAALDAVEGMFAFALYDEDDGSLVLARDRFGEKPLLVLDDDTGTYFASELRALFALLGRRPPVNRPKLLNYLFRGYRVLYRDLDTWFQGVRHVQPATTEVYRRDAGRDVTRYWSLKAAVDPALTMECAVETVREAILHSVALRLRADVPIAFLMSGGIDSNALIALAARRLGYDVHGFTIRSIDPRYDESALVQESAAELGIRHTFVPLSRPAFLDGLRAIVRHRLAPIATISYYVHWLLLQRIAREGYRVAVSGTGADELFTGYYDHFLLHLASVQAEPAIHARARADWEKHIRPMVRNPLLADAERFIRDPSFRGHLTADYDQFESAALLPLPASTSESSFHPDPLRNRMQNELFHEVVPVILAEDDQNAMAFSVENRSPYLDRRLCETAGAIPTAGLIADGYAKRVLREAMKGTIPEAIRTARRKVGFNAALTDLLDLGDASVLGALLDARSPIFGLVDRQSVSDLFHREPLPEKFLFNFICAKLFLEEQGATS